MLRRATIWTLAAMLQGCVWFVSHYDAVAYQYFTSLKAFHIKFLEDNKEGGGKVFDAAKVKAACDAGDLRFREAREYAAGKQDSTRANAVAILYRVFERDCGLILRSQKLFGTAYADEQIGEVTKNYDLAISGEEARVR